MKRLALLLLLFALSACAPMLRQAPSTPGPGFRGPHLEADAVVSFDGARLGLSAWEAKGEPWAVIVA
ncbi:MAG TPA: alpha/beta hydrolase, partial [Phenylobacterium sp.]|nr:alpha/beta hydrolase [Phenylobacterium sp.]